MPDLYATENDDRDGNMVPVRELARFQDAVLVPSMNVKVAADMFASADSEELAVVGDLYNKKVVGLLTGGHLMRRYAEELEKARRDLTGEV